MKIFAKVLWVCFAVGTVINLNACQQKSQSTDAITPKTDTPKTASEVASSQKATSSQKTATASSQSVSSASSNKNTAQAQSKTPKAINWDLVDSGIKPVDKEQYKYPFELDSVQVKAYMDAYHVDAKTARYNLTVGMAVNEILDKMLDQIGTAYVSHELTAGKDSKFVIHTTQQIAPSEYIYVFDEKFAHGLTIPVQIINDGKK